MDKCIEYNLVIKVQRRKYEINSAEFVGYLRRHKTMSNKEIAERMNTPITAVEHWFRTDKCHAIPPPQYWFRLKEVLGINSDLYDKEVTTFEEDISKFEMRNRAYAEDGISPTIKASGDINVVVYEKNG